MSPVAVGIRYGLITGLLWIIVDFILRATELSFKYSIYVTASIAVYALGIILAHRFFKQQNHGFMTYGQGILIVVVLSLISGFISSLFNYAYVNFIDPDYPLRMRTDMEAWMSSMPGVQEEQIQKSLEGLSDEKMKSPLQIGKSTLGGAFGGLITGLIVSIFTKHKRPEFE
ncbi:DUF4199 domain-containing protein [Hymenobacter cellulosilyticus]|uniref:DUF4199 domain-containing protein n=1 Tax=Hymenobacter cellulosilyticus TaxID=2932248 RepID=A0A8T9Q344_9BACT|nr:DUF4199 domain-containing protein [Hymenobacter cellulosilyticus]UOQ71877.1 DUF4199 domain-containing protein [Hymenobacter cellulosilyticus]